MEHKTPSAVLNVEEEPETPDPFTLEEFLQAQRDDKFCRERSESVGDPKFCSGYDRYGVLVRKAILDGAQHKVVPERLRHRLLHLTHYPVLAGHPGGTRMYYTLRREYYWPQVASDVFSTVRNCRDCIRLRGTHFKHQKLMKLFFANGPLEFVAMDLFGPLKKTARGNTSILFITDRFTKMTRCIPLRNTTAATVAAAFLEYWVYAYGAAQYILTDNGKQFVAKFFDSVCGILGSKQYFTSAYHPRTDGQTERFNEAIVQRLRHYVVEPQTEWDQYLQPLAYSYITQVHQTTGTTPFHLVLTRHPPSITLPGTADRPGTLASDERLTPVQHNRAVVQRPRYAMKRAGHKQTAAQRRYKENFEKKVRFWIEVQSGDQIYVGARHGERSSQRAELRTRSRDIATT